MNSRDLRFGAPVLRIGSVSYINAKPLIFGLENDPEIALRLDVPARLLAGLRSGELDVALLPVIDYQKMEGLKIVPSGGIGSDGPTLTVRIFSPAPVGRVSTLACDPDSHTSVALARIILSESFHIHPEFVELTAASKARGDALLLIGDKVVRDEPRDLPYQLDLGAAWKELTGLPFVFAVWTARSGVDLRDLPEKLSQTRQRSMREIKSIVAQYAVPHGWTSELAAKYLTEYLEFEIGDQQLKAIELFHQLAFKHGLIGSPRKLELY